MRIVMNQYADGDKFAAETATDGSVSMHNLLGARRVGARISAYTEIACDGADQGLERLEQSLEFLLEEVRKRRGQPVSCGGDA
jgi:hypothetical protein